MLAIGTLDGTLPCTGCGKKISNGEWGRTLLVVGTTAKIKTESAGLI